MAPEVQNSDSLTPAADIWCVGLLVAELLTGDPAFPVSETTQRFFRAAPPDDEPEEEAEPPQEAMPASGLERDVEEDDLENGVLLSDDAIDFVVWCLRKRPQVWSPGPLCLRSSAGSTSTAGSPQTAHSAPQRRVSGHTHRQTAAMGRTTLRLCLYQALPPL